MPPAVVQAVKVESTVGTTTLTFPAITVTAGNMLVAGVASGASLSISSIAPATFTLGNIGGTGARKARFGWKPNAPGGSTTVIVTMAGSVTNSWGVLWEVSGCDPGTPLDQQATGNNAAATPINAGALTTTQANEIIFAIFSTNGTTGSGNSWTVSPVTFTNSFLPMTTGAPASACAAFQVVSSIQTGIVVSGAFSGGSGYNYTIGQVQVATFIQAPAGGGGAAGWVNRQRKFVNKR